jgi:hypothetical protein
LPICCVVHVRAPDREEALRIHAALQSGGKIEIDARAVVAFALV